MPSETKRRLIRMLENAQRELADCRRQLSSTRRALSSIRRREFHLRKCIRRNESDQVNFDLFFNALDASAELATGVGTGQGPLDHYAHRERSITHVSWTGLFHPSASSSSRSSFAKSSTRFEF